jgi:hypothetical protein
MKKDVGQVCVVYEMQRRFENTPELGGIPNRPNRARGAVHPAAFHQASVGRHGGRPAGSAQPEARPFVQRSPIGFLLGRARLTRGSLLTSVIDAVRLEGM